MLQVFQNYIQHIENGIYQILYREHILDGLKFPGTGTGIDVSNSFIDLVKNLGCLVDNHGWNGITGQLHDPHFADRIHIFDRLNEYFNLPGASDYSGHIGTSTSKLPDGNISQNHFDYLLISNLFEIRKVIFDATGRMPRIYGEGIYPYYLDPRTITPEFLNHTLKSSGLKDGLDGLVVDICHSSISADYLSKEIYQKTYTFENYLDDLDLSQIAIIHCSGGYNRYCRGMDCNFLNNSGMDPHLVSFIDDWEKLLLVLRKAQNVHRVSNEIAYSGHHGGLLLPKDYCSEAIMTRAAVETQDLDTMKKAQEIVQQLHSTCDNLQEIIAKVKELW